MESDAHHNPLTNCVWHLGKAATHMRETEDPNCNSPQYAALVTFWETEAGIDELTEANVRRLLELARLVPGFPTGRLKNAEQELARLK